jgi:hypothetical protein
MAQSRKRTTTTTTTRTTARSESKKPAGKAPRTNVATVEIVEEEKGLGIDDGIIIVTTIVLLAAFVLLDFHRGKYYGEGMLFKGSYGSPQASAAPAPTPPV